jgi:hypothetical protein
MHKLKVGQLRQIAGANGINVDGKRKAEIIELLKRADENRDEDEGGAEEAEEENEDEEVVLVDRGATMGRTMGGETEKIKLLQMQMRSNEQQMQINEQKMQLNEQELRLVADQREAARENEARPGRGEQAGNHDAGVTLTSRDVKGLLPKMSNDETDVVAFFHAFERVLEMNDVGVDDWSKLLAPHLTPKAARVYSRLSLEQCRDYVTVKEHILKAYNLTQKSYWESFKRLTRQGTESYTLFANRLTDIFNYYVESKQIGDLESLKRDVVFQQFLESLNRVPSVKHFVLERNPVDLETACELADLCFEVSRHRDLRPNTMVNTNQNFRPGLSGGRPPMGSRGPNTFGGNWRAGGPANRGPNGNPSQSQGQFQGQGQNQGRGQQLSQNLGRPRFNCYWCGSKNHKTVDHRNPQQVARVESRPDKRDEYVVPTYVNGRYVRALRDTGASVSCVNAALVSPVDRASETISLRGIIGERRECELAWVKFLSPALGVNQEIKIRVAVIADLIPDMLIGNELFAQHAELIDIIQPRSGIKDADKGLSYPQTNASETAISDLADSEDWTQGAGQRADRLETRSRVQGSLDTAGGPRVQWSKRIAGKTETPSGQSNTDKNTSHRAIIEFADGVDTAGSSDGVGTESQGQRLPTDTGGETVEGSGVVLKCKLPGDKLLIELDRDKLGERSGNRQGLGTDEANTVINVQRAEPIIHVVKTRSNEAGNGDEGEADTGRTRADTGQTGAVGDSSEIEFRRMAKIQFPTADRDIKNDQTIVDKLNEFATEQRADKRLDHWFKLQQQGDNRFTIKNGVLFKFAPEWSLDSHHTLLVIPTGRMVEVLKIAHDDATGGHQGVRKVYDKIAKVFAAPTLRRIVTKYVRSCKTCQLIADKRLGERVPLYPIPVIGPAFSELIVDVLGKMPRTSTGIEYVLTIVCQSTRWVTAVPIRNLKVTTIADALMAFQLTHGFAKRIRFDKFASLTSGMMRELQRTLGIEVVYANVLHHESIGQAERAQRSLERMIKAFVETHERQWDKLINYFCFAINDTINATTHYAPSYLVYGRRWRGLLEIMRDSWITGELDAPETEVPVYLYIERLKERLKLAADGAKQFAELEQERYKAQFDKHSTERQLNEGDLVLIMQPTSTHKILNKLDGPYPVRKKLDRWNYEVNLGHRRAVFHINSLRKFIERDERIGLVITPQDADDEFELSQIDGEEQSGEIKVGRQLTNEQRRDVDELITQFADVFSGKLGLTDLTEHVIQVTDETPISRPAYRVPRSIETRLDNEIGRLLGERVIEPSVTPWATGVVPVIKSGESDDAAIRLTCDFRALNKITVGDAYPMQNPAEILSAAAGAEWISKIDIRKAFFQVPMAKESERYTGFRTKAGLYCFKRMAMGLKNAPKTMQRLMDAILRGCHRFAQCHVDDVIVHTASVWSQHISHLREVLIRLRNAGLTVNVNKCEIAMPELRVLGHTIKDGTIGVDDGKVEAIRRLAIPTTKREVKQVLGLLGYYMKLIPNFAGIAGPLTDLLRKEKSDQIEWTPLLQKAFDQLKTALTSKPVLCAPNFDNDFILQTDASNFAIAAILSQLDDQGRERVVSYASRKLLPRESNYSTIQKELLAIVWAANHFETWIYGHNVICQSDHRPLAWLDSMRNHNARLMRWSLFLQKFDLNHSFKKGVENANTDSLTRLKF